MVRVIFLVVCLCVLRKSASQNMKIGDACQLKNGAAGICKQIRECPKAKEDLKKNILPTLCRNELRQNSIVCCTVPTAISASSEVGEISKEKCKEYAKSVFQKTWTFAGSVEEDICGFKAGELVVGGEEAKQREFPHQALLGYGESHNIQWKCGGSLISENFVLTAAHCRHSELKGSVNTVRLGELDYSSTSDPAEPIDIKVAEFITHPQYKPPQQYNDIALIKLEKSVTFGKYIRPACIHSEFTIPPTNKESSIPRFIASGFGLTEFGGEPSSVLLKVTLDFFPQNECENAYKNQSKRKLSKGILEESQLCAGGRDKEKDTCRGDSGGPLVTYHLEKELYCMYRLVGVTAFGTSCGVRGVPGVYTRVSHYVDWIEKTVWPKGL